MFVHGCHPFFGFGFGLLALILFFGVLRHRRYHRMYGHYGPHMHGFHGHGYGYGHDCGPRSASRPFDEWNHAPHFHGGMMRGLMHKLDTTPGQEKAIRAVVEDLRARMKSAKSDEQADLIATFRHELSQAFERILETLDDKQKKTLAELIGDRF